MARKRRTTAPSRSVPPAIPKGNLALDHLRNNGAAQQPEAYDGWGHEASGGYSLYHNFLVKHDLSLFSHNQKNPFCWYFKMFSQWIFVNICQIFEPLICRRTSTREDNTSIVQVALLLFLEPINRKHSLSLSITRYEWFLLLWWVWNMSKSNNFDMVAFYYHRVVTSKRWIRMFVWQCYKSMKDLGRTFHSTSKGAHSHAWFKSS